MKHRFWHLVEGSIKVQPGQRVESGDLLAMGDNTGMSTGNHLHRGLKPQIEENGEYRNELSGNGYYGAIDPEPYYFNIFIGDYMNTLKKQVSMLTAIINMLKLLMRLRITIKGRY